jgi:hypothetical protein
MTETEWIRAEAEQPPHEKHVLLVVHHFNDCPYITIGWYNHHKYMWRDMNGERIEDVLWWRHLPALPDW